MNLVFKKPVLIYLLILASCTSCSKKPKISDQDRLNIKIQAARLADVPMPFGAQPVSAYISDHSFGYLIGSKIDLFQYYLVKLDQYGWNLLGKFEGLEQNLIFEKPHKLLSIIIRKHGHDQLVVILTENK